MSLSLTPQHAEAIRLYEELLERFALLDTEKGQLLHHTLPLLNAKYVQVVGDLKLELLQLQYDCFALRRKLEMIRSAIQRGSPVLLEVIETLVEAELKEQRIRLQEEADLLQKTLEGEGMQIHSEEDAVLLKKTYHYLAKRLHPDLHPDADQRMKELWLQVADAYARGDLQKLQVLAMLMENENFIVLPAAETLLSELVRKNNYLKMVVQGLVDHIAIIKSSFPYTHMEIMDDLNWVDEQRKMHVAQMANVREEMTFYSNAIDDLTRNQET